MFLKQQEDMNMKISSSQFSTVQSKSRQQLEEEREAMFAASVKRVQEESRMQMERAKMEEQKRLDFLKQEEERRAGGVETGGNGPSGRREKEEGS